VKVSDHIDFNFGTVFVLSCFGDQKVRGYRITRSVQVVYTGLR